MAVEQQLIDDANQRAATFVAQDEGRIWRAPDGALPLLSADEAGRTLPLLPLLLTVGRGAEGLVMLDLEVVGSLARRRAQTGRSPRC